MDLEKVAEDNSTSFSAVNFTVDPVPEWEAAITGVVLSSIILLTVAGNTLVIMSVFRIRSLRIPPNYFIASLAGTDITVAVLVLPFSMIDCMMGRWIFGMEFCRLWMAFNVLSCSASILHLCAIALDRYWAIKDPVAHMKTRTVRRILTTIVIIWSSSFVLSFSLLFGGEESSEEIEKLSVCLLKSYNNLVVSMIIGLFYLTLLVTTFIYARLFVRIRRRLEQNTVQICVTDAEGRSQVTSATGLRSQTDGARHSSQGISEWSQRSSREDISSGGKVLALSARDADQFDNSLVIKSNSSPDNGGERVNISSSEGAMLDVCGLEARKYGSVGSDLPFETDGQRSALEVHGGKKYGLQDQENLSQISDASESGETLSPKTVPFSGELKVKDFNEEKKRLTQSKERRLARTLGLIMGAFVVCWLPFFVMYLVLVLCSTCKLSFQFRNFITWLGYINSTLNPLIYTVFNKEFRRAFKKILHL
ncbi:probable G-protein coupled receptor No18 [Ischnura elegans]|uniref:probable G-protein coupled receptor No18 n=1 Tax=Ischnura elegans TaxID=197161 RepID=UPI001ED88B69|nr:probable G-protein coupled receptor No18 [Ischnura elegans]